MCVNSQSLLCFSLAEIIFPISFTESPSIEALAVAQLFTVLANVHLTSVLAVTRTSTTAAKARLQNFGVQYLWKQIVVRTVQFLVIQAPKTSNALVVVTVLVLL